ncbi:hypothetical protein HU200_012496 [Digitaria exilis]|uniref:Uncharacterized protein n=1 Tax=Digitaria exilis TaxID=1010633 RepID=A0A835KIK0_9POAL|nr:hypothetical protein HU200_017745 [Digitaria exilis]KAF8750241.1 hypothetical protein HU200_012496 [Digitaria exilis]
MLWPSQFAQQG